MSTTENATVEDGTGQEVLDELNEVILAIITMFSNASAPASPQPYQNWVDTDVSPSVWFIRNADNTAWIKVAEFENTPTNQIRFFHLGAAAVGSAIANTFTATQTIDQDGAAGELGIGSNLQTGIASIFRMFAENDTPEDFDALRIQATVTDATTDSEAVSIAIQTMQAGTLTTLLTLAAAVVTIAGTLNATTLQQGGVALDTLINNAIDGLNTSRTLSGAFTLAQSDAGGAVKFTGASAADVTCGRLALDSIIVIHNRGTADLTLVSAAASDDVVFENGTTIAAGKTATLIMIATGASQADNVWRVLGENT